jgi:hypothetical protein
MQQGERREVLGVPGREELDDARGDAVRGVEERRGG